ncbi:Hypothetical predicted protein [Octopus vulgaris]|uniref:Uncharacterized protein n=1 Tax=Octopus vulgaris TaxID=6645 RepID=A0AA36BJ64_OCTVU|nr:Hypothetical predicted protein [Octopus vulgaris]
MCDKQYCITFGQKPALACFICGQGIHEACYLKKINNHTIPDILGLHWLCGYCSPRATITNEPRTLPQTGRSKQTLIGETDMANKSCHTQAIQVPLVNDKNEDNDMQTPTKQETGDPAEKDQTSHEKKQIQSKHSNEERPVCIHYRSNKCKHGPSVQSKILKTKMVNAVRSKTKSKSVISKKKKSFEQGRSSGAPKSDECDCKFCGSRQRNRQHL